MSRKILTIEEIDIWCGYIIFRYNSDEVRIKVGQKIMLRKPNGVTEFHNIACIGSFHKEKAENESRCCNWFFGINDIKKDEISVGTEVWTID
jgi:hypothetical protein